MIRFFIISLFFLLFIHNCRNAGVFLQKHDEVKHGDAIVVLMGSITDRVLEAADLYNQGLAQKLIMVETLTPEKIRANEKKGRKSRSNTIESKNDLISLGIPRDSIIVLPGGARSTQMEAQIIRDYLKSESEIDTILLVSSSEHTRRASMIFGTAFKYYNMNVIILCSPSKYTNFNEKRWWRHKNDFEKVFLEYLKIGNFILLEKRRLKN